MPWIPTASQSSIRRSKSGMSFPSAAVNTARMPALTVPAAGEKKINQALQTVTSVDFQETPLADVIDYLKHKFGIEIQLDPKGLSEESLGPSTPITKNLNNVKLRSVLRLILGDLNLAYVVKDDILLITSIESADSMTTTRVYDAADLLLPIPNPFNNIYLRGGRAPGGMPF